jgi:hypothetical protein
MTLVNALEGVEGVLIISFEAEISFTFELNIDIEGLFLFTGFFLYILYTSSSTSTFLRVFEFSKILILFYFLGTLNSFFLIFSFDLLSDFFYYFLTSFLISFWIFLHFFKILYRRFSSLVSLPSCFLFLYFL